MGIAARMNVLGTEKAFEVLARAQELSAKGRNVINLGIGQPDFLTPSHIVEAACKALKDGQHGYTSANGILPLREAIAADIELRRGVKIDPEQILVVPGGKPTMAFAMLMLGEPGVEILFPDPGYPVYSSLVHFSGATPISYPLNANNGFSFSADEVLARLSERTRLIIINSPANPSGSLAAKTELDKLVAGVMKYPNIFILADEIYARIVYEGVSPVSLISYEALRERLILLDGCSKVYAMTGWRLGWGIWPRHLVAHATRLAINFFSCVNSAVQYAGIAAITGPQSAIESMIATFDERRKVLVHALNLLPGVSCAMPLGAFYAFPNIEATGFSSTELQNRWLEEAGVAVLDGLCFGKQGGGYLRFSYANSIENICEAMRLLALWLQTNKPSHVTDRTRVKQNSRVELV